MTENLSKFDRYINYLHNQLNKNTSGKTIVLCLSTPYELCLDLVEVWYFH